MHVLSLLVTVCGGWCCKDFFYWISVLETWGTLGGFLTVPVRKVLKSEVPCKDGYLLIIAYGFFYFQTCDQALCPFSSAQRGYCDTYHTTNFWKEPARYTSPVTQMNLPDE